MISHPKKRGEWVELQFLARVAAHGLTASKPWGDSTPYDCVVESNRVFNRVQVKSTANLRHNTYVCSILEVHAKRGTRYSPGVVDFFAIYLVPDDLWYIIPAARLQGKTSIGINPRNRRSAYLPYLEAWHLLAGASDRSGGQAGTSAQSEGRD